MQYIYEGSLKMSSEDEEKIREALANGTMKRCIQCGNPFTPDILGDFLCPNCRGEPKGDEPIPEVAPTEPEPVDNEGPEPIQGHPDPVPEHIGIDYGKTKETTTFTNAPTDTTFSAIPPEIVPETKTEIPVLQKVTILIKDADKSIEDAKLVSYVKNPATNEVILRGMNNDTGKPIEMTLSDDFVQQLIRELLPDEKKRQQELLDKMHSIRKTRGLSVEKIDALLSKLSEEAEKEFRACKTGTDVKKTEGMFRAKLAVLTQKRYLAKFSIQEESELSLQLAKLQHGEE
jgi:hypothetical protein